MVGVTAAGSRLSRFAHGATSRIRYARSVERPTVIDADGILLDRVLESRRRTSHDLFSREESRRFHEACKGTVWGRRGQRSWALAEGQRILATAERYELAGIFDGRAVRVCGIGTVCAEPSPRSLEHARVLVDALADDAAGQGRDGTPLSATRRRQWPTRRLSADPVDRSDAHRVGTGA